MSISGINCSGLWLEGQDPLVPLSRLWHIVRTVWLGGGVSKGTQVKAESLESQLDLSTCRCMELIAQNSL